MSNGGATLTARLEAKIRRRLLTEMTAVGPEWQELDLSELLHIYGNWSSRFVPEGPRRVHRAAEFAVAEPPEALKLIREKIRTGEGLTPHLSRNVRVIRATESHPAPWRVEALIARGDYKPRHRQLFDPGSPRLLVEIQLFGILLWRVTLGEVAVPQSSPVFAYEVDFVAGGDRFGQISYLRQAGAGDG